jgi:homoserine kinase type II
MAVFTELSIDEADRVSRAHGLGATRSVTGIPAGSVNSNFFVETEAGTRFLRIYEEQDADGVAYEWALLDHLGAAGLPVPRRVPGPGPGQLRVAGKPTALFEIVGGLPSCQSGVTVARAAAVGRWLGDAHRAGRAFPMERAGRFTLDLVAKRLESIPVAERPELGAPVTTVRRILAEVRGSRPVPLAAGVIHGDLFRDNVRWEGDRIVAVIDWESASHGPLVFDLMVAVLAWSYDDTFRWDVASAICRAYDTVRPLDAAERASLRSQGLAAAARFTTTRITDFYLREGIGERVYKDYRRFLARLETLDSLTSQELVERLL